MEGQGVNLWGGHQPEPPQDTRGRRALTILVALALLTIAAALYAVATDTGTTSPVPVTTHTKGEL